MNKTTMITITNVASRDRVNKWNQYRCVEQLHRARPRQTGRLSLNSCSIVNMEKYSCEIAPRSTYDELITNNQQKVSTKATLDNLLSNQTDMIYLTKILTINEMILNVERFLERASILTFGENIQFD